MSEVKRYFAEVAEENDYGGFVLASDFDRVTAERDRLDARLSCMSGHVLAYKLSRQRLLGRARARELLISELQRRLTAADERADVLDGLLRETSSYLDGSTRNAVWCDSTLHKKMKAAISPPALEFAGFKVIADPSLPPGQIRMCNCNQGRLPCTCKPSAYDGFDNGVD